MKSMTGYGSALVSFEKRDISVEMRSVNNRYFDCTVKMPRIFAFAEEPVKAAVQSAVSRGKIDIYININNSRAANVEIAVKQPLLEGYLEAFREVSEKYGIRNDISMSHLLRVPDIFSVEKSEEDAEELTSQILETLSQALGEYGKMRIREGERMREDIRSRSKEILSLLGFIEKRSPDTVEEYRVKLETRMKEILNGVDVDPARILTEAAIFADKVAIAEETVRLRSHLLQLKSFLESEGPIGRKLDFLLQEINRETNTIGSKANDIELARAVVDLKSEIEKIREQVQNIE